MSLEGGGEGLPLLLVLGLVEHHVPVGDGVLGPVGDGGDLEGLERGEEVVSDFKGSPIGSVEVGVI